MIRRAVPLLAAAAVSVLAGCAAPAADSARPAARASSVAPTHPAPSAVQTPAAAPSPARSRTVVVVKPTARPSRIEHVAQPRPTHSVVVRRSTPPAFSFPVAVVTGNARQVVTVSATSYGSSYALVQAWQKSGTAWRSRFGPYTARIGSQGMTWHASESRSATPIGTYTLTEAFGFAGNPGTRLPYRIAGADSWWVSDARSPYYNTWQEGPPGGRWNPAAGEQLADSSAAYRYAVVINYNRWPVRPGAGSAFFLHVTNGAPTAGCVAISQSGLVAIMRWLDPAEHPRIAMGVGG